MLAIAEFQHMYPHQLSGGQQQRVAIARALAPRPGMLLLDEPFSNMDIELREQIARELRMILKQDGMTTILVTHNQLEAFAMADEIGVIRDGMLLQWDTCVQPVSPARRPGRLPISSGKAFSWTAPCSVHDGGGDRTGRVEWFRSSRHGAASAGIRTGASLTI